MFDNPFSGCNYLIFILLNSPVTHRSLLRRKVFFGFRKHLGGWVYNEYIFIYFMVKHTGKKASFD